MKGDVDTMTHKTYSIESADFMLAQHTYKGEPITAIHELKGKIYVFTANHTYVVRKIRWYERLWRRLTGGEEGRK